jgi:hypothetical protein
MTSGADWPAVVAAISGGVVGLAGVIFAWRQSNQPSAPRTSAPMWADQYRIYANYLAALSAYSEPRSASVTALRLNGAANKS